MIKQLLQQSTSTNGKARLYAFENTVELGNLIPPTVSYESGGNTLIVGPSAIIQSAAAQLSQMTSLTLLSTDGEKGDAQIYYADSVQLSGFLGTFTVLVENQGQRLNLAKVAINHDVFDVVLDLSLNGLMSEEVPVPGYYPVGRGYPKLTDALQEIPTLMGTFDKPKYFRLDTDLCAHSSRGVKGCERCVDACPAGAAKAPKKQGIELRSIRISAKGWGRVPPVVRQKRFITHYLNHKRHKSSLKERWQTMKALVV